MTKKSSMKHLTDANFDHEVQSGVTLVDFYADWCGPCKMLTPVLEQVAEHLEIAGKAVIGKIDIDTQQEIARRFKITSVPTMVLFKEGKEVNRLVGLRNVDAIKDFILSATRT